MAELQCAETSGHRVLIIEDEGMVAMLLEDMLTNLGYEVVAIAGRMERAAELVTHADIDVAILDVNLNGELTYSLASALESGGVPFVFVTGYSSASLPDSFRVAPVLQKPFLQRTLKCVLDKVMKH
ncbi:MAG TPA: response regulator [Burkholderiales bacterium]|nr:response regulator [Burkholderiales bacterium]